MEDAAHVDQFFIEGFNPCPYVDDQHREYGHGHGKVG